MLSALTYFYVYQLFIGVLTIKLHKKLALAASTFVPALAFAAEAYDPSAKGALTVDSVTSITNHLADEALSIAAVGGAMIACAVVVFAFTAISRMLFRG